MKRKWKSTKRWMRSLLAVALACTVFFTSGILSYADVDSQGIEPRKADVQGLLTDLKAAIEPMDGDKIPHDQTLNVKVSFGVPVIGDGKEPEECIQQGDTAEFQLAKGFTLVDTSDKYELKQNDVMVGHLTIAQERKDGVNVLTAKVVFDGDHAVFDGSPLQDGGMWSNVVCSLSCQLKYDDSGSLGNAGSYNVMVLDKTYQVVIPEIPTTYAGEKSGTRNGDKIDWKVKVAASKGAKEGDLSGMTLVDDLADVGEYVPDSFAVGTTDQLSDAAKVTPSQEGTKLTYLFPENTTGTRYVYFSTKIPEEKMMTASSSVYNKAQLMEGENVIKKFETTVSFTTEWIKKELAKKDDKDGTISWTITANQSGTSLSEAMITDQLDEKLDFVSASWKKYDAVANEWNQERSITPDSNGNYRLGEISTPVQLTISAKLKNEYDYKHTIQHITNKASISWKDHEGINSNQVGTDIGMNPISKTNGGFDASNGQIKWNVNVKKSDMSIDLRVLDLLVYGNDKLDASKNYTLDGDSGSGLTHVSGEVLKKLKSNVKQSYVPGSFQAAEGCNLTMTTVTVKDEQGKAVADLLVVTGSKANTGIDPEGKEQSYSYKTQVADPALYMGNTGFHISNTAELYSANSKVNNATAG